MSTNFTFRDQACRSITNETGVYVLCDLDQVPLYVGQSKDGIRSRVRRHLTSARSDVIANRQVDIWEVAYVMAYPVAEKSEISAFEDNLYHCLNDETPLMNGTVPPRPEELTPVPAPAQIVQVMTDAEILDKQNPHRRLPRQAAHYSQMVDHFLNTKNSAEILRAIDAHFARLSRYHQSLIELKE